MGLYSAAAVLYIDVLLFIYMIWKALKITCIFFLVALLLDDVYINVSLVI